MKVVFNSDDFGLAYSFTEGAKYSRLHGVCSSVSIRVNGPAYKYATGLVKRVMKGIGVGIHLSLEDGKTQTSELSDDNGFYKYDFVNLLSRCMNPKREFLDTIEKDLRWQFESVIKDGITPDHADSERHVHMIPAIFEIVCKLCSEYKVGFVRTIKEPVVVGYGFADTIYPLSRLSFVKLSLLNYLGKIDIKILKKYKLKAADAYYGVFQTNNMNSNVIIRSLEHAQKRHFELVEIFAHPGIPRDPRDRAYTSPRIASYANLDNRITEKDSLTDKSVISYLKKQNIRTIAYREL